ncbi:MAG: hypothetical protein ACM3NT_06980, partial [Methylocystaceae bacterium]
MKEFFPAVKDMINCSYVKGFWAETDIKAHNRLYLSIGASTSTNRLFLYRGDIMNASQILEQQQEYMNSGQTYHYDFRITNIKKLK